LTIRATAWPSMIPGQVTKSDPEEGQASESHRCCSSYTQHLSQESVTEQNCRKLAWSAKLATDFKKDAKSLVGGSCLHSQLLGKRRSGGSWVKARLGKVIETPI
jgi:hypothetical protein